MKTLHILFASLLIAGCGGGGGSSNDCSVLNARIFNGDSCNQAAQTPVVAFRVRRTNGEVGVLCTGTLVTVDDILTSAHCFDWVFTRDDDITEFRVIVGGQDGEVLQSNRLAIHPFYNGRPGSRYDIAMLTLVTPPNPPIGPMPLLLSELTDAGSEITAFGYGLNQAGEYGELKAAKFTVSGLSRGNLIVTGQPDNGASVCPGDSGGPAVYEANGIATLAGVNSFILRNNESCVSTAARTFGFVDIQDRDILDFILAYAPDVPVS